MIRYIWYNDLRLYMYDYTTHRVPKSQRSKMGVIAKPVSRSQKLSTKPFITTFSWGYVNLSTDATKGFGCEKKILYGRNFERSSEEMGL